MQKIFSMSFNVNTISVFERQAKRLMKKFPSLKQEIQTLISELRETVFLLTIYDKSDMENISNKEIIERIKLIP